METHRLLLSVAVFAIIFVTLFTGKPTITGFVPTEAYSQELDLYIYESQRFVLTPSSGDLLKISSLSLTGDVNGPGLVNIYLTDDTQKWLVFSNKKKERSSMDHITGLTVHELDVIPGEKLHKIESVPVGYKVESGSFYNVCLETCVLDENLLNKPALYLDVILEPGTTFHISGIRFSTMSE